MRLATIEEAQAFDLRAQKERGISGEILMESAGALASREIREFIAHKKLESQLSTNAFVGIVCGPGGNGADGLVVARHLASAGLNVRVYLVDAKAKHDLFSANLERLPLSIARSSVNEVDELKSGVFTQGKGKERKFLRVGLLVDALLGLGLDRDVRGIYETFIDAMNSSDAPTVSLDLPSGLDANTGRVLGCAVCSKLTLTFSLAKPGFFVNDGPKSVGRLRVLPIGIPLDLIREVAVTQTAFTGKSARRLLPGRSSDSNKSSHGRVVIFAGQAKMIGAGLIAGLASMRVGVGYVTLVTHLSLKDVAARAEIAKIAPEFLTLAYDDPETWKKIGSDVAVVGPGFGVGTDVLDILKALVKRSSSNVVVDADALTSIADEKKAGRPLPLLNSWILTPHAGELARLIGGESKELEANRFDSAKRAAKELRAIVLFKGFRTVVSDGERSCVILSGNSALAKAGSGDTLAGIIGGCLAQKTPPFEAACLGAYIHGRLADEWLKSGRDILSLQPTDLAALLPQLLKKIRTGS